MDTKQIERLGGIRVADITKRSVTEDDVQNLEWHIGATLPDDYRNFLLQYGSGEIYFLESVGFPLSTYAGGACGINSFFGAVPLKNSYCYDLISYYDLNKSELPEDALAIADDGAGNYICLRVSGEATGTVYFWDHEEYFTEEKPTYTYMQPLASSFSEFIGQLQIYVWE